MQCIAASCRAATVKRAGAAFAPMALKLRVRGAQSFRHMSSLEGTKTLQNLKDAFAAESLSRMRYLYFAQVCAKAAGLSTTASICLGIVVRM
jgi:hypothetical protein